MTRSRSHDLHPSMGAACALLIGLNLIASGALYLRKRRREAFQALVLPFVFWPTFLIAFAITDGSIGPFSSGKFLLISLSVAIIVGTTWFLAIRALPWPSFPVEALTPAHARIVQRRARGLSLVLLLCYIAIGGFGAFGMVWSLRFIPGIIAPGSGGSAQMLLAFFLVPVFLMAGSIFFVGIAGVVACWKHLKEVRSG